MKKQTFEPVVEDGKAFTQHPVLRFQKSGGILHPTTDENQNLVKSLQLSDFGKKDAVQIELIKEGHAVKAIQFRCGCGCEATVELLVDG